MNKPNRHPNDLIGIKEDFEKMIANKKPIKNSYQVTSQIYAGEYPRDKDEELSIAKLKQFEDFGVTHFVDLTEDGELAPYHNMLYPGASHVRFPIRDVSVPKSMDDVRGLVKSICEIVNNNPDAKVYIHCWGGVGRTGVIVGCLLSELYHQSFDETMAKLENIFLACPKSAYRKTPETQEQRQFISKYVRENIQQHNNIEI
ncbi:MAG: dual specificity protein phosphatase family protein [Muribaculaceae bacterium]|nr:dual specificity protein phosphatase family protein [Muribaculaceae bacterium]